MQRSDQLGRPMEIEMLKLIRIDLDYKAAFCVEINPISRYNIIATNLNKVSISLYIDLKVV